MYKTLVTISSLLLSIAILLVGSGLLGTLLSLRGSIEGYSASTIGIIMAIYRDNGDGKISDLNSNLMWPKGLD